MSEELEKLRTKVAVLEAKLKGLPGLCLNVEELQQSWEILDNERKTEIQKLKSALEEKDREIERLREAHVKQITEINIAYGLGSHQSAGVHEPTCPECCKQSIENKTLKQQAKALAQTMEWVRQAIHQAFHDGQIETCQKNTCGAIKEALAAYRGEKSKEQNEQGN